MIEEKLNVLKEELLQILKSSHPDLIEKIRKVFDEFVEIKDQKKVMETLEPLMPEIILKVLEIKGLSEIFK